MHRRIGGMEQRFKHQHRPRRQDSASVWDYSWVSEFRDRGFKGSRGATGGIYRWVAVGLVLYFSVGGVSAQLQQKYCSSQNTGEGHYVGSDPWQTLGLCKTHCAGYAFGVVKGYECWCSDYAPNPSNARTNCVTCPQYDQENCGNAKAGTYGYIDTGIRPKGTAEASEKPTTLPTTTAAATTSSSPTVRAPKTSPMSSHATAPSSAAKASTSFLLSSGVETTTVFAFNESSTATHTTPWITVLTVDGPPKTVTFTPSGWAGPTESSSPSTSGDSGGAGSFFDNAGRVAGVFTVLALLVAALVFAVFWYIRRRKQKGALLGADSPTSESFRGGLIGNAAQEKRRSRSMSTLGLTAPYASDKPPLPPPIITSNSASSGGSGGLLGITPDRVTDQRLDPGQVWMRFENDNASRMSVRSLRDDQDYSRRVLRLTNPDED